jgi:hypothetical protein
MESNSLINTRQLVTIRLEDVKDWRLRTVLLSSDEVPTQEEVQFYYSELLGIQGCTVTLEMRIVPDSFQLDLIGSLAHEQPEEWPHMDKSFANRDELNKYLLLLDRVAEIEYMRLGCGIVKKAKVSLADQILVEAKRKEAEANQQAKASKRNAWIRTILESLNCITELEHDNPSEIRDSDTIAWIFAPLHKETRNTIGYRIITDQSLGNTWANRVGTPLYPDITLCRRISSVNWRVSSESSLSMVQHIMNWYVQSRKISTWIPYAIFEVDRLLEPFRRIEYARQEPIAEFSVSQFLQRIEDTHLYCVTDATMPIYELGEKEWKTYLYHILKHVTRGMLDFDRIDTQLTLRIREWIMERRGIYLEGEAFIPKWAPLWELIMLNSNESPFVRFHFFLQTLDANDATRRFYLEEKDLRNFANAWIKLFINKEIVSDPIQITNIYAEPCVSVVATWIYQYVPELFIQSYIRPQLIQKAMEAKKYYFDKTSEGFPIFQSCTYKRESIMEDLVSGQFERGSLVHHKFTPKSKEDTLVPSHTKSKIAGTKAPRQTKSKVKPVYPWTPSSSVETPATPEPTTSNPTISNPPTLQIQECDTVHMGTL